METFVSGYCRVLDAARTVCYDSDDHCSDCVYPDCVYKEQCTIGKQLIEIDKENG